MEKLKNYIHGEWVMPKNSTYSDKIDPATAQSIYQLPQSSKEDVDSAVESAQRVFRSWSKLPAQERANYLNKIADGIERRIDEFALAETLDVGKPLWLSKQIDIPRAVHNFRFFAGQILHQEEMSTDMDGKAINYTLRQPIGVAALITPWNLPIYLLSWKIAPALAVGNTAVCKPSELTSKTAFLLAQVMHESSLPFGVCNFVFGDGAGAGSALVEHPQTPIVSFTGGTKTGAAIQRSIATMFKKVSLELGGKNPAIIFDDADLDKTIPSLIRSSYLNQGQICLGCERVFVHEKIYETFVEKFVDKTKELKIGDPMDSQTYIGPLVSRGHMEKVVDAIHVMKEDQAKLLYGFEPLSLPERCKNGFFVRPTILESLPDTSSMHQQEFFGPVVVLIPFSNEEEVIGDANRVPYGLSASVYTENINQAHRTAAALDVGTVWINTWLKRDLRVPFGGMKQSGVGREGGEHSIDFYTERKTICVQLEG